MSDLTPEERKDWEAAMQEYMSMISERDYCAGWMSDLTESLSDTCKEVERTRETSHLHGYCITPATCELLTFMAAKLGYWMDYEGPYQPD